MPAGFARFALVIRNSETNLSDEDIKMLGNTLKCKLKVIWAHY
jgi:hypothetical protein